MSREQRELVKKAIDAKRRATPYIDPLRSSKAYVPPAELPKLKPKRGKTPGSGMKSKLSDEQWLQAGYDYAAGMLGREMEKKYNYSFSGLIRGLQRRGLWVSRQ